MFYLSGIKDALEKASLHNLMKALREVKGNRHSLSINANVYVLTNHTIDNFQFFLDGFCFLEGINLSYAQSGYDLIMQEIINKNSLLYKHDPDVVVLSLIFDNFVVDYLENKFSVQGVTERFEQMTEALLVNSSALLVLNTFLNPLHNSEGILSNKNSGSIETKINAINSWIQQLSQKHDRIYAVNWNQLEQKSGATQSRDYRMWYMARSLLTNKFLKEYALEIVKLLRALKGKSKKCIVLDCDNTLWGGIIGEDDINNIQLNPHDYPGNIFYHFQRNIRLLFERGVIVALCSKNNEDDVWEVLNNHSHCLLKKEHLSAWRINWANKGENIQSISEELNIGKDSIVFVDDNPAECELVRQLLPEITVLQVPSNLFGYPYLLFENGLFDNLSVSKEDRTRTKMYQAESKRREERKQYNDIDEFLTSLQISVAIHEVSENEIPRVAQLTQKTNQFNLTTRRYSEENIKQFINDPKWGVFSLSVRDKFGDSGLTGVFIARKQKETGSIDTILLSCRILGKKIEQAFVTWCMAELEKRWEIDNWIGEYIPTSKNQQVADFLPCFGFRTCENIEGKRVFHMKKDERIILFPLYIQILTDSNATT